jgi:2-amino-4-hydroxy-6-hydroxymethyldihydropteridine diphosphokinase
MIDSPQSTDSPIAIALGANLGNPLQTLQTAIAQLNHHPEIQVQRQSHWYQTKAIGPVQPDYINGVIGVETNLSPEALMGVLHQTEADFGRVRRERWGPRTLDLDLISYGQWVLSTGRLILPHPRCHERPFVLMPLLDIAPDWVHPVLGLTAQALLKNLAQSGIQRINS